MYKDTVMMVVIWKKLYKKAPAVVCLLRIRQKRYQNAEKESRQINPIRSTQKPMTSQSSLRQMLLTNAINASSY